MLKPRKKFTKKELREDKFVTATFKTQTYIQENRTVVTVIVIGILVLFAGIIMLMEYLQTSKAESGTLVSEGTMLMDQGSKDLGMVKLKKAVNEYSDESAAYAAFLIGRNFLTDNIADSAAFYFKLAADKSSSVDLLGSTYMNLASCQQILGNLEEAETSYQKAVDNSPFPDFKANAMYNLGLIQQELKQNDAAVKTFNRLVEEFPQSKLVDNAKTHIDEMK